MPKRQTATDPNHQHELELKKLEIDRERVAVDRSRAEADAMRAINERITLMADIVTYMNRIQDAETTVLTGTYETVRVVRQARPLNPHEEDILNACLIGMKKALGFR